MCASALAAKYDLGFNKRKRLFTADEKAFYCTKEIEASRNASNVDFDTLFDEIESNLSECNSDMAKRNYCLSLIRPFAGFLMKVRPIDNETGNTDERAAEIESGFYDITQNTNCNDDSVEAVFIGAMWLIRQYANRLDWVLLQNGVDLMRLQRESGIWLKRGRLNVDFMQYGTRAEEAQRYIDALPQVPTMPNKGDMAALSMPTDKDTTRTEEKPAEPSKSGKNEVEAYTLPIGLEEAFNAAMAAGFMERGTTSPYRWLYGGNRGNVRLAFFLQCVLNPDGCSVIPYSKIEPLFGVKNLAQTRDQMNNAKNPQKWKNEILKIIPQHP